MQAHNMLTKVWSVRLDWSEFVESRITSIINNWVRFNAFTWATPRIPFTSYVRRQYALHRSRTTWHYAQSTSQKAELLSINTFGNQ